MRILEITAHYFPNIGGVETHLTDLVKLLSNKHEVFVLTYQPLTTKVSWEFYNKKENVEIFRAPWFSGLFYKFVNYPILEFLYLLPGLFFITPIIILLKSPKAIHAHGLVAGAVAVFWGKLFKKRVVIATHSIYHFPQEGLYREFVQYIFQRSDIVMGLSKQAVNEILALGIPRNKVKLFTYWIDLEKFKRLPDAKGKLNWNNQFRVLFVGRLIAEKGVLELLRAASLWDKEIILTIIGTGPLETAVKNASTNNRNVEYLGSLTQDQLPFYYNAADLIIVPSINQEGFGRVILEALACGTPVVGSNIGAIPEAMDESVGKLIEVNAGNIAEAVNYFYNNPEILDKLSKNTRRFAEKKYSIKNVKPILDCLNG